MWPVDDIFVPPIVITLSCRDTISARTVVGHSLLLARLTVSDVYSRLVCFQSTSTSSALEVLHIMRYINLRLTYYPIFKMSNTTHVTGFAGTTCKVLGTARLDVRLEYARCQLNHLTTVDEVLLQVAQPVVHGKIHQYLGERTDAMRRRRRRLRGNCPALTTKIVVDRTRHGKHCLRRRLPSSRAQVPVHLIGKPVDKRVDEARGVGSLIVKLATQLLR